jgi:hypothetical protein
VRHRLDVPLRETNPIFRRGRVALPRFRQADCAKRTQFPPAPGGTGPGSGNRETIVQNEANFAIRDGTWRAKGERAKQTQFPAAGKKGQVLSRKGFMVNHSSNRPRQNKANSAGWDAAGGVTSGTIAWARCAKRTQFAPDGPTRRGTNKANSAANRTKRTQFPGSVGRTGERNVRNEAKLGRAGVSGDGAWGNLLCDIASMPRFGKQTQFAAKPGGTGDEEQMRKTNPISDGPGWGKAPGAWDAGRIVRNEANSGDTPRGPRGQGYRIVNRRQLRSSFRPFGVPRLRGSN